MKMRTTINVVVASVALSLASMGLARGAEHTVPRWDPDAFRGQSTLEIMTIGTEEGEHWTRLWWVVVDGQLYVQLGDQAFRRVQKNFARPYVQVKIADQKFARVRLEAAPDMKQKVAAAMAAKYPRDDVILRQSHPTTARLVAEPPSQQ
jgi:glucose/arabinose dehydrogenase